MISPKLATLLFFAGLLNKIPWLETQIVEPCIFKETELSATCVPCEKDKWLQMVKPSGGGVEEILNANKTCFNNDPITTYHGGDPSGDGSTVMATGEYKVTTNHGPRGFILRKEPFFRYAYMDPSPPGPSPPTTTPSSNGSTNPGTGGPPGPPPLPDLYLDLNDVKKYYVRTDSSGNKMDADFQLLEWPGPTAMLMNTQLNLNQDKLGMSCGGKNDPGCKQKKKWMLQFERENGKILYYPCNPEDGTNIVAVASIRKPDPSLDKKIESAQQIWLAHGNKSLFDNYVQPLYVPQYVLEKMVKVDSGKCKIDADLWDLRTVLDFTFTRNRLVLGMKCGILVVKNMASSNLNFSVASLKADIGTGENLFSEPINKVSSSTCCLSAVLCGNDGGLVAAYSFNQSRKSDENKFIYVSFDYGDTFETKIIGTIHSPINLIAGLYKLYGQWHDYYEILHNPDEDDLKDDEHEVGNGTRIKMKKLRSMPVWQSSTTEEKEKLFSIGTPKGKKKASLEKIVEILETRVPVRRQRRWLKGDRDPDMTPQWVLDILNETRTNYGWDKNWGDGNCDSIRKCKKLFENDRAVDWLLGDAEIHIKTAKRYENEPFCNEIVSMLVLPEERHLMVLCQVGYESLDASGSGPSSPPHSPDFGHFALYNFPVKVNLPLIYGYRVSQRVFACKYIKNSLDPNNEFIIQPEIVRIQNTATIFVINCEGVIYLSTNFGNTLFNIAFYYEQEPVDKYCLQDSTYVQPTATNGICEGEKNRPTNITAHYLRTFRLCALNVPPVFATDASGYLLLITFGKFYAHGAIAYNRETRLVVGEVLREMEYDRRFENLLFPSVDINGETTLTISLTQAYSIPQTNFKDKLYNKKHGLRLVQMPLHYHKDARNFDNGNLAVCKLALEKKYGLPVCKTSSYTIYPKRLDMDIGEKQYAQVEVINEDPYLPLWIFSSNENSVEVKAFHSLREGSSIPNLNVHNWKLELTSRPNNKSDDLGESFVDAFFASDYNKLNEFSTQISFVNRANARCHVRPSSTVNVQIGCKGKRLVAFEDKYRPQCKFFRNSFNYTLRKGLYDPDLANLWMITSSNRSRSFYKINSAGDLVVTYDYVTWGCPVEPFAADRFIPDLRIVQENTENDTTTMKKFEGKFVLIEIFGAQGFSYSKKVKDMNCIRAPQYLPDQLTRWKQRQRLFTLASERQKFPRHLSDLDTLNFTQTIKGNKILQNYEVKHHINIWNRANYLPCYEGKPEDIPDHILEREYQILKTRSKSDFGDLEGDEDETFEEEDEEESAELENEGLNEIVWNKDHPRVFLFLAVAVDEYNSICDYQALFGVSLKTIPDMEDLYSFIVFLFFVLFWLVLVVGGYHVRKRYLKLTYMDSAKSERLEQAAWSIIYRYEKLIHGNAMDALFNTVPDNEAEQPPTAKLNLAAKSAHDKRRAELRMKKTHIMAQEQARHERLQKLFQKQ